MHRRCAWILVLPVLLCADPVPRGIVRGELLSSTGGPGRGELTFRDPENRVFVCRFDERTYFEKAKERITSTTMRRGDRLEVLADQLDASTVCYARTVQVVDGRAERPKLRVIQSTTELFAPRGDMTFSGVVLKVQPELLILRTRAHERRTILLRPDTRYLSGGQALERASLLVNTTVFIRAGRNLEDDIEAYQVIWGEILEPVISPRNY